MINLLVNKTQKNLNQLSSLFENVDGTFLLSLVCEVKRIYPSNKTMLVRMCTSVLNCRGKSSSLNNVNGSNCRLFDLKEKLIER